jgi:hypothetical protein
LRLRVDRDVLPTAPAATFPRVYARRRDACGRSIEDFDDATAQHVGFVGGHVDADPLAGERAVDQRDPPVIDPAEGVTAGNHPRRRQFHPNSQARSLRDSRIAPNGAVIG